MGRGPFSAWLRPQPFVFKKKGGSCTWVDRPVNRPKPAHARCPRHSCQSGEAMWLVQGDLSKPIVAWQRQTDTSALPGTPQWLGVSLGNALHERGYI